MKKMIWLVILAATTTWAAAQPSRNGRGQREDRGDRRERIAEVLDLTEEQQTAIKDLRITYRKSIKEDQDALRLKKVQLENEATSDGPNAKNIDQLTDEIGVLQTNMLKARVAHQIDIRSLLDDEQKIQFDAMHRKRRGGPERKW